MCSGQSCAKAARFAELCTESNDTLTSPYEQAFDAQSALLYDGKFLAMGFHMQLSIT